MTEALIARLRGGGFFAHFSGTVLIGAFGGGITVATHMVLAAYLDPAGYGAYAVAFSALNIVLLIVRLGLDVATVRYVAVYTEREQWQLLSGFLYVARRFVIATGLLVLTLGALLLWLLGDRFDPLLRLGLITVLPSLPLLALGQINDAAIRGGGRVLTGQLSLVIVQPLLLLLLVGALWLAAVPAPQRLPLVGAGLAASFLGAVVLNSLLLARGPHREARPRVTREHIREWLFSTPTMMVVSSFSQYQNQLIVIFVGFFLNIEAAGIFALAMRLSNVIQIVLYGANQPAMPRLSQAFARGDDAALSRIAGLAATACFLAVLPIVAGVALLGPFLLSLLGPAYAQTYVPLMILCLGLLLQSAFSPVVVVVGISGNQNAVGAVFILSILLCLGGLFLFGHLLSLALVALAAALLGVAAFVTLAVLAYRRLGVRCWVQPSLLFTRA